MKTASEIVNYLVNYYQQEAGEQTKNLLPDETNDLVRQMGEFLSKRLEEDTPHKVVWDDFSSDPQGNSASLAGILEALFEAQPGVRDRVNSFMHAVTAIETKASDIENTKKNIEDSLQSEPGGLVSDEVERSAILADKHGEKVPPAYLYGNERAGFEAEREASVSKSFMVGRNAQIIYVPTEKVQFPFMFMHLGQLTETSKDLNLEEKHIIHENIEEIRFQLTRERSFDDETMANAFENIWEVAPSYANALIESLQSNIDTLPVETRDFIIQLHSPLH